MPTTRTRVIGTATDGESHSLIQARRTRRVASIWLAVLVFVGGNVAGWVGLLHWGPAQSDSKQLLWVHASAAMFWLAAAMLFVSVRDLVSIRRHGSRPPTEEDLPDDTGQFGKPANVIRKWMAKYQALVGAIGLVVGALFAHFVWKP